MPVEAPVIRAVGTRDPIGDSGEDPGERSQRTSVHGSSLTRG